MSRKKLPLARLNVWTISAPTRAYIELKSPDTDVFINDGTNAVETFISRRTFAP